MAQVAVQTTRFPAFADITSAYALAFVLRLYLPFPSFASSVLGTETAEAIDIGIIGGLLSSFLLIVDPVNKFVRLFLARLLQRNIVKRDWAYGVLSHLLIGNLSQNDPNLRELWISKAGAAYYSPYLAKLRAQISGGVLFSAIIFAIVPQAVSSSSLIAVILLLLGIVTVYSISRDVRWKVPAYSWIIAVYTMAVEYKRRNEIGSLDRIAKLLAQGNWEEARSWLSYELTFSSASEPNLKP